MKPLIAFCEKQEERQALVIAEVEALLPMKKGEEHYSFIGKLS